jgi:UDP-2,3-diacylglucosamine pyrophosphatase LpxH
MKIKENFIQENKKIKIISNGGKPSPIQEDWRPVLDGCEMLVIIPDLHMYIYNHDNLDNFKYGAEAMLSFLDHLDSLKEEMDMEDKTLRIYQLGDLYELRFPGLNSDNATATEIRLSHPDYDQIVNTMDGIQTHFLFGNHDFESRHFPKYQCAALEGKVYIEHGFAADKWKDFANPNAPLWEVGQLVFLKIRELNQFFANLAVEANVIGKDEHFAFGVPSGKNPNYEYPSEQGYIKDYGHTLNYYTERLQKNTENKETKICVVGHTHHPYINTDINAGKHIYIDAGAWTSGRSDFVVITNEETAICSYER